MGKRKTRPNELTTRVRNQDIKSALRVTQKPHFARGIYAIGVIEVNECYFMNDPDRVLYRAHKLALPLLGVWYNMGVILNNIVEKHHPNLLEGEQKPK